MKKIRNWIQDYFGYSPKETSGFLYLMILMIVVLILPGIIKSFLPSPALNLNDEKKLDSLLTQLEVKHLSSASTEKPSKHRTLFSFNPNSCNEQQLIALGLEAHLIKRILNYRNKDGKFIIRSDFKKIYGMSDSTYKLLYPYIDLPIEKNIIIKAGHSTNSPKINASKKKVTVTSFDLNLADSSALIRVKGIGSKLAKRIIAYRNKLGGFVHKDQLKEVYGLDSLVVSELSRITFISTSFKPRIIHINTASFDELRSFPYLNYKLAKTIIAYRKQHGPYLIVSDLLKIQTLNTETYSRIEPYIQP